MPPINANVTNNQITATVGETQIDVNVSGGFGPSGAAGAAGQAATITVGTVTTGAPGSSASVVNGGSSSAAVLNFTIPAGATGATGPQGATGPAGTTTWAGITDKPSTFAPSTHTHDDRYYTEGEVDTLLAGKQATGSYVLTTDARLSDARQPLTHGHGISDVTGLSDALASKATPADVTAAVAAVIDAAPASLDTLNELAAALGDDANFASTVTNALAAKAPLASPTFTGTVSGVTKAMVGLSNVDNTSDAAKPVSTATQAALDAKAALVHTHTVSAITDAGSAATRNAPATGNAGATEVVLGSDTRLTDARTPTSHAHGFLTNAGNLNDGANAAATNRIAMTNNSGQLVAATLGIGLGVVSNVPNAIAVTYGTSQNTACQGNDSRLSDARTPTAHTQAWTTITSTPTTLSGYGITDAVSSTDARLTDARTPLAHNQAWSTITSTPTTLAGYGITDAAAASHAHTASQITDFASAVAAVAPQFAVRSDTVGSVSYIGRATSGTATSSATWTIRRTTVAAAGTVTTATATSVKWDDRLTVSYA